MRLDYSFILRAAFIGPSLAGGVPALAQDVALMKSPPPELRAMTPHIAGRVEFQPDGSLLRQWPGTYLEAAFDGRKIYFRVGPGAVSLRVRIDGGKPVALVKPVPGLYRAEATRRGRHRLRIDVVSESQAGPTRLGGLFLGKGATAEPLAARPRQIEFIGDSHTVGYGNTAATRTCSEAAVWAMTDTSAGVAPAVAARYDADYQVNAISGRGVVRNYNGFAADTLPAAYPFLLFDKEMAANDPAWRPQAIVMSLGTNDFSTPLHAGEKWSTREQLHADFEESYARFIDALHRKQPQAYILLWASAEQGSELAAEIGNVAERVRKSGNAGIGFVAVPGLALSACNSHPSAADDKRIAEALIFYLDGHETGLGMPPR